jgi:GntR family transcriptional regulator
MFQVSAADPTPLYAQLDRAIRAAIATGRLRTGDQLPTVRQMAVDLRINANTVAKVYAELERAGVLESRRGVGTFVLASHAKSRPRAERLRALESLGDRILADAAALGFTVDDVVRLLQSKTR